MGAHVVDGAPLAVLGVTDAQRAAVDLHDAHGPRLHVRGADDRHEAAGGLLDRGHAACSSVVPMRPASAPRTRSPIVSSWICATTCSKNPRTIIRSAATGSR